MTYRYASIPERRAIMREHLRVVAAMIKDENLLCAKCGRETRIFYAYRCRWCGFYFCPVRAAEHFGLDVSEWRLP